MPFSDEKVSGQRAYSVPQSVVQRVSVAFDGGVVRLAVDDERPVALGPTQKRSIPSGRLVASGDLEVTLGAAAARAALDREIDDGAVATASLVAALSKHPVTGQPATFVYSHHLAHALGEDPDEFSEAYHTLIGPVSDGFRSLLARISVSAEPPEEPPASGSRSRSRAWLRDERILALDLYFTEGPNPLKGSVEALSELLRSLPIERELAMEPAFRSPASVARKLGNFQALDPDVPGGLEHGSAGDAAVWSEFAADRERLRSTARTIRGALLNAEEIAGLDSDDPDSEEALEGTLVTRLHRARERSRKLVENKKRHVRHATGVLRCEACNFNFVEAYGAFGTSFIECHHRKPVSELVHERRTRLEDLALVCANCHRMIHHRRPWLTVEQLRLIVDEQRQA
jgi:5-methylcytosine-specific restriction protein A